MSMSIDVLGDYLESVFS